MYFYTSQSTKQLSWFIYQSNKLNSTKNIFSKILKNILSLGYFTVVGHNVKFK